MAHRKTHIGIVVGAALATVAFALVAPAAWGDLVSPGEATDSTATQIADNSDTLNVDEGGTTSGESSDEVCLADAEVEPSVGIELVAYTLPVSAAQKAQDPQVTCAADKSRLGVDIDDKNKKLVVTVKPRPDDGKCVVVNVKVFVTEDFGGGKVQVTTVDPKVDKNGQLQSIEVPFGQNPILVVISFELKCGNATVKPQPITFQYTPRTGRVTVNPVK